MINGIGKARETIAINEIGEATGVITIPTGVGSARFEGFDHC